MKEMTVIELSKLTGLSRSKIYYLNKIGKLMILNGKINYEDALQVITSLAIKKTKITNQENFRHILNMLHLQNITLQKQLDLAYEREKTYLSELASYRQSLLIKPALPPFIDENNSQVGLESDLDNIDKNCLNAMPPESENHTPTESCQSINEETQSTNEAGPNVLPTTPLQNEMILSETKHGETASTEQKKEAIEQKDDALDMQSTTQGQTDQPPTLYRRTTATAKVGSKKLKRDLILERRPPMRFKST
ncbi:MULTISPECIES: hypothetical protein [Acinetobacter]|jgi:hypothetical protein|uniref:hypothetical protein n=1 Tax=Acinetobacter TaxID=469 RepID=UPI0005B52B49|nr:MULTISPECIES: hypothetical protein [Acinetobacter]MBC69129.1 hypothetical protein [Acinetobacter sp.]MBT48694.1 hypothetical protein [Acinetobacter sp.]MDU2407665.1 hypothetical protein [Acinetobacter junii]HJP46949.1 hypothetical protein [Acinetobacter venetianus]